MSKIEIYKTVIKTEEDRERLLKFINEYKIYLGTLPASLFIENKNLDFVVALDNCYPDWETDDDKYITEQEIYENAKNVQKVSSVAAIIDELNYMYKIPKELFLIDVPNHIQNIHYKILPDYWKCPVVLTIPKIERNLNLVVNTMKSFGYYMAAKITRDRGTAGQWIDIVFNPMKQDSIREMLNDVDAFIYHYSPSVYDEDIEENGLVPRDGTRIFKYKKRVFYLYKGSHIDERRFKKMMQSISVQKQRELPEWTGDFTEYIIRVRKLPDFIQFYYDPNARDSVYTDKVIELKYVISIDYNCKF